MERADTWVRPYTSDTWVRPYAPNFGILGTKGYFCTEVIFSNSYT